MKAGPARRNLWHRPYYNSVLQGHYGDYHIEGAVDGSQLTSSWAEGTFELEEVLIALEYSPGGEWYPARDVIDEGNNTTCFTASRKVYLGKKYCPFWCALKIVPSGDPAGRLLHPPHLPRVSTEEEGVREPGLQPLQGLFVC